jgi:hypothetical protein
LKFESAKAIKGQIIADFITEHHDPSINLLEITPGLYFLMDPHVVKVGE